MSDLEAAFLHYLHILYPDIAPPILEHAPFPGRKFRADFAWPERKIAVEVQGMCHRTVPMFAKDITKRNLYTMEGWKVLEISGEMLRNDPEPFFKMLQELWEREKRDDGGDDTKDSRGANP